MDAPSSSGQRRPSIAPSLEAESEALERLSFARASQAQILRSHQRDTSQISNLTHLTSEVIRSIAGTRWLAHRQTIIDILVRAVYLILTFGRGAQTLGEEYTDILPYHSRRGRLPSRSRRLFTVLFLLFPSFLTTPSAIARLRASDLPSSSRWAQYREKLASFLESPAGRALPEIHMVAFLFSGRFFEFGKRLTGLSYISALPPKPPGQGVATYEPLALMMLVPLLFRLFPRATLPSEQTGETGSISNGLPPSAGPILPLSPPLTPPLSPQQTIVLTKPASYDTPNTYLDTKAIDLPERQCTLCLESRGTGEGSGGTVAVTECGHVFCWGCLGGLEKPECPLCRQSLRMERLIAAYNL